MGPGSKSNVIFKLPMIEASSGLRQMINKIFQVYFSIGKTENET